MRFSQSRNHKLIIELKAAKALADEHTVQVLGCLRAACVEQGLLMNFGAPKFDIRKYALSRPDSPGVSSKLMSVIALICGSFALFRG